VSPIRRVSGYTALTIIRLAKVAVGRSFRHIPGQLATLDLRSTYT
jgi:hypothetical protein